MRTYLDSPIPRRSALQSVLAPLLLGAVCWLYSPPAQAQGLAENVQLGFGALVAPPSGSETWTIDLSDTGSGTAEFVGGTTLTGDYTVTKGSGPPRTIFIDVAPNGTIPGLTIGQLYGKLRRIRDFSPSQWPAQPWEREDPEGRSDAHDRLYGGKRKSSSGNHHHDH